MSKPGFRAALFVVLLLAFGLLAGLGGYYAGGRSDAIDDARPLARLADRLEAHGHGGQGLGVGREALLLTVLDPATANDPDLPSAGVSVLSRTLAERMAAEQAMPDLGQIRRAGYASGLESTLSRSRLVALWLETVEMGRGPHGWLRGLYNASKTFYGRKPEQLSDDEFVHLLAVATKPRMMPDERDIELKARVLRIQHLFSRPCGKETVSRGGSSRCNRT
jgi:hypothetical protein